MFAPCANALDAPPVMPAATTTMAAKISGLCMPA
jgi:hypothetical protein